MADSHDTAGGRRARRPGRGSVPLFMHGLLEYGLGVFAIAAPFLLSFDNDGAIALSVLLGAGVLVLAGITNGPTGVVRSLPIDSHVVLDVVIGVLFVITPFVFGFTDDATATALMVLLGLAILTLALMTRYHPGSRR